MSKIKYLREGRGQCVECKKERDLVVPVVPRFVQNPLQIVGMGARGEQHLDPVVSRHLHQIEEYGPKGALPGGFCPGSLKAPVVVERLQHNHPTREIRKPGRCPACDLYHAKRANAEGRGK